jgi:chloride channel protein, CIC family
MLLQSGMTLKFPNLAKRRGVTEVIKAVAIRGGYIPFRTTLFHFIAPVICIGTGGTVGPEGPAAQIGGGVGSKLGNLFGLSDSRRRMFTAAAAGAAISAVFNTPLGGIFFALEIVLLNDFQSPTFSALILASVSASAVSRIFLGDTPAFLFEQISIGPYNQLYLYALLGILSGILSLAYVKYTELIKSLFSSKGMKEIPLSAKMAVVGLFVGIAGYFYNDIFGIGYHAINAILANSMTIKIALILLVLKFILVPLVLQSGGFGGIFAPSLFMGACFGYLFAVTMNAAWGLNLDITTFTLVGMGSVLGGINTIPISSILILFEMTKDYSFILPLMLAVVTSTMIVQFVIKGSVHVKSLERQGFNISQGREISILRSILVKDIMTEECLLIPENTPLKELIENLMNSPHSTLYTVDSEGNLRGKITENQLRPIISEYENIREMLLVNDIASKEVETVLENDDLDYVLRLFGKENVDVFPVISSEDHSKILGTINRQEVIAAYNKESLKYNLADGIAGELKTLEKSKSSSVSDGYSIIEKIVPNKFIGHSLLELDFRNRYDLQILMIKKRKNEFDFEDEASDVKIPGPNYLFKKNDIIVLFGKDENIKKTKEWDK